ncbi:VanZ family protein [Candidatus Blastococcus massiliensis]|uniref:VanZ family protein n=1 Tax=Candidatus Blastococcus massiliensis TaxID=1470358 RepID=UPI0004ADE259|nr:VanZ family protein [Candidatus Blastococcus massiliensis]
MITNVLLEHSELVPLALALVALACAGVGTAALRLGRPNSRLLPALAGLSVLAVLVLTLAPTGRTGDRGCTVQFALPALGRVELLANVALLLPAVVFATLATRRPWAVLVAGSALSVGIEAVQALVPAIGRTCDTNDWSMNTLGVVIGAGIARATLALADRAAALRIDADDDRMPSGTAH